MKPFPSAAWFVPAIIMTVCQPVQSADWEPVDFDGVDYISIEQIQTFYAFKDRRREGATVHLETDGIDLKFEIGTSICLMNGIKFILEQPVRERNKQAYVSRADLIGLIEPVLRPRLFKHPEGFRTIILDPLPAGADTAASVMAGEIKTRLEHEHYKVVMAGDEKEPGADRSQPEGASEPAIVIRIATGGSLDEKGPVMTSFSTGAFAPSSVCLATTIHGTVMRTMGKYFTDEGVRRGLATEFPELKHPAILISAPPDEASRQAIATAIVTGVNKYRSATQ